MFGERYRVRGKYCQKKRVVFWKIIFFWYRGDVSARDTHVRCARRIALLCVASLFGMFCVLSFLSCCRFPWGEYVMALSSVPLPPVHVPKNLLKRLQSLASTEEVTLEALVLKACRDFVEREEEFQRLQDTLDSEKDIRVTVRVPVQEDASSPS